MREEAQVITVFEQDNGIVGFTKLAGAVDNNLQHRADVGR